MKYRPEIDGLRAVAVVPVILFHGGFEAFSGGFVGVDVFFVISGFLITSIIVSDLSKNKFSFLNFYERRARRIMPMLFFIIGVSSVVAWFTFLPSDMEAYSSSITACSIFSSNFLFWQESGYWDISSELKPLIHTWSLAVEEQYYILFPILLFGLNYLNKKWILVIITLGFFGSLALAEYASTRHVAANFYLLPTRAWELAVGAIIALLAYHKPDFFKRLQSGKAVNEVLSALGIILILISVFGFDSGTPFPGKYALLPTLGSGMIIIFCSNEVFLGRILCFKPVVMIGQISYSAYLLHQPIFAFLKYNHFPEPSKVLIYLTTFSVFPLAYLCWKYIENPFRDKSKFNRKEIFSYVSIVTVLFMVFGLAGSFTNGFENRLALEDLKIRKYTADNSVLRYYSWNILRDHSGDQNYQVFNNQVDEKAWFTKDDSKLNLLIVGDSHSKDLYNTLVHSSSATKNFQMARYGLSMQDLFQFTPTFYNSPNYQDADMIMLVYRFSKEEISELNKVLIRFRADHKKIVIVENIYEFMTFGRKTLADFYVQKSNLSNISPSSLEGLVSEINTSYYKEYRRNGKMEINTEINDTVLENSDVIILDRMDYICDDSLSQCYAINEQLEKYFYDYGHNTLAGAEFYGRRVDQIGWLEKIVSIKQKE